VSNLPAHNPTFTGRADLLDQLHQRLHPGQPAAVVQAQAQAMHGLGGVGKAPIRHGGRHRGGGSEKTFRMVTDRPRR
jgi:hypothetical protein